ncbi:hypothetical protein [Aquimarina sp. 2201CG5-10]|uniref:hypothetical protein n=1 Tax=Aquimarina callyspongiae TaxID=3098150 RepID=UPI002AB5D724|nr:hypothetical protein [Aquimarina sp. 2201CG5-10]MDY8136124.1 hypothetical protein [Aquimarina sp. 2201CG5-10]
MKDNHKQLKSIWGKWWEPLRKWFYPTWLLYETLIRFYGYTQSVYNYFIKQHHDIASYIGEIGSQALNIFCSAATFVICVFFLTVPACFILYKFFKIENLTSTQFEQKIKVFF